MYALTLVLAATTITRPLVTGREGENKISIRKSYKKPNPLAKHIVCTCGYALCWHKDKKTEEELFYCRHCRAHKENGKNLKVPAATIYKKVMDALELEHLEEEKLAAAIQQGAGRKVIEAVRAEKSVQMKSVLAELNMEQFRRVPLYESYMADEITKEQYCAELLDYEEAHRKLNEQLTAIMEDTLVWERALSLRNPWIQQMAQYKTPEELDHNFVKKYIEQVTVTLLDDGQVEISLTMKTDEWKQMLSRIEILLGQVTKEHTQKEVTNYIKKVYNPSNKDRQIGFQPTRRQGRKYKEDDLTYNRNLLGHGDIEKVVSEEKIRQLSRSIMDVLWFSLWNKAE